MSVRPMPVKPEVAIIVPAEIFSLLYRVFGNRQSRINMIIENYDDEEWELSIQSLD